MGKLFGTDGIRGKANQYPIDAETALKIGKSVARYFSRKGNKGAIIVGKDPRLSGDMLAHAAIAGICSMGVDAHYAGTLPTPGVATLIRETNALAGIMISASHNPYFDNGIKVFDENGYKLSQEVEDRIETLILNNVNHSFGDVDITVGKTLFLNDADEKYRFFLKKGIPRNFSLSGLKIVLDCANGATYKVAPVLFRELGATVLPMFIAPDGVNINDHCGSQYPEALAEKVLEENAHVGLAFDGDGDRLITVDEKGNRISGDRIIAICGKMMKQKGILKNNVIVTTVMSNLGLRIALEELGIDLLMTDVGDRHVLENMIAAGSVLGGEDSGHTIFLQHHTTGDGILTALKLMEAMPYEMQPLSKIAGVMNVFPQVLINVPVKEQKDFSEDVDIQGVISKVEAQLGKKGRVLVRYSGTRPLCRVMVEGPTKEETSALANEIAAVVKERLG